METFALSTREAFSDGSLAGGKPDVAVAERVGSGLALSLTRTFLYWAGISKAVARTATERRAWRARPAETAAAALSTGAETVKAAIVGLLLCCL